MPDSIDVGRSNAPNRSAVPLRKMIYEQLVSDILSGSINAGERLSEADLVERFGVSKTPIREAFIQLEREGYILLKKNVGAVVQKISIKMVEEIFTIVSVLESYATETVVAERKLTKSDIAHLAKLIQTMKAYSQRKKYLEYRLLNVEFHGYFVEKLGNETLKKNVVDLRRRMYGFVSGGLTLPLYIDRYVECHRQILDAVKKNDATKAAALMRNHLMESKDFIVSTLAR
ncbi:MAG: GntR family transcriptional regulator [Pseudomonadota bacterium]